MQHVLADHLRWAARYITQGDYSKAMLELKRATRLANKLKRRDMTSLIFRAMNVIRPKLKVQS
ncbi:hypothetical protein [Bradyrhizobium erythrophlei]|uniref:Uncharacterized protein n=1 Tax=Bradyrhizobium erythrophlei TaxID=1437360 RepID=A0A1M5T913_9BRAD|nr:hypothetical protein [Bradyrhizobium erythrophlei]SHH47265.1 hypothetical protein SAMN05444169_7625 [Bradyrhizobium erythrophlei]